MDILILDSTAKSIVAILGEVQSTTPLEYTVAYGDATSTGFAEANQLSVSNDTSYVTICSAPAASTRRVIKNITIYNKDIITHNILIKMLVTATYYTIVKVTLTAGESWSFKKSGSKKSYSPITESSIVLSDVTTNDSTSVNHGFLPKLSGSAKDNLDGLGNFRVNDGWIPSSATWSYSSVDSPTGIISVDADVTALIQKGMRLKYNQPQALTAYFPFDANSTSTVGSFTSADQNTPTYTAGKFSNALTLVAASSQAVNITDTALMKPTGDFTIGAWFKTGTASTAKAIFSSYSANTNIAGINFLIGSGNIVRITIGKNTGTTLNTDYMTLDTTTNVTDNAWHYAVATFRNNYVQVYIDGNLEASGYCVTPAYAATNYVRIGCVNSTGTNANFFNGQIDDLFLINGYALDEETIKAKYIAASAQGTGDITVTKKAIVTNVGAWSGSATLITAYHGTDFLLANAAITSPYYSNVKIPFGFNISPDKWTQLYSDSIAYTQNTPTINVWYNPGSISLSIPIGLWRVTHESFSVISGGTGSNAITVYTAISTSNSGAVIDTDFVFPVYATYVATSINPIASAGVFKEKVLALNTKTTYYLIERTTVASAASIQLLGNFVSNKIKATSVYL